MGGYLCNTTKCDHCKKSHCGPNGTCTESGCICKNYTKSSHYSEFC